MAGLFLMCQRKREGKEGNLWIRQSIVQRSEGGRAADSSAQLWVKREAAVDVAKFVDKFFSAYFGLESRLLKPDVL